MNKILTTTVTTAPMNIVVSRTTAQCASLLVERHDVHPLDLPMNWHDQEGSLSITPYPTEQARLMVATNMGNTAVGGLWHEALRLTNENIRVVQGLWLWQQHNHHVYYPHLAIWNVDYPMLDQQQCKLVLLVKKKKELTFFSRYNLGDPLKVKWTNYVPDLKKRHGYEASLVYSVPLQKVGNSVVVTGTWKSCCFVKKKRRAVPHDPSVVDMPLKNVSRGPSIYTALIAWRRIIVSRLMRNLNSPPVAIYQNNPLAFWASSINSRIQM